MKNTKPVKNTKESSIVENKSNSSLVEVKQEGKEKEKNPLEKKAYKLLKNNGMLDGYKFVLENICKDGLPQGNVFEYAAFLFSSYEKKWKQIKSKEVKEKIMKYKEEKSKKQGKYK